MAVLLLFLLNMGTIGFLYLQQPVHEAPLPPKRFDKMLIETLQLNDEQIRQFNVKKRQHHEAIMQLDRQMKAPVEAYFHQLNEPADATASEQLEKQITAIYTAKLHITYRHFEDIKNICTPEQQAHFQELIPQMIQVMEARPPLKNNPSQP